MCLRYDSHVTPPANLIKLEKFDKCLILITYVPIFTGDDVWYKGCYDTSKATLTAPAPGIPAVVEGKDNPGTCSHRCLQNG